MTSLLVLLPQLFRHIGDSEEAREQAVFAAWIAIAGPQIRRISEPLRLERKTLLVAVPDQTWRTQLDRMRATVLFRLNSLMGTPALTAIEFVINPDAVAKAQAAANQSAPGIVQFTSSETEALPLTREAAGIPDAELRGAFLRAAGKCLERRAHDVARNA